MEGEQFNLKLRIGGKMKKVNYIGESCWREEIKDVLTSSFKKKRSFLDRKMNRKKKFDLDGEDLEQRKDIWLKFKVKEIRISLKV